MADKILLDYVRQVYALESQKYTLKCIIDELRYKNSHWQKIPYEKEYVAETCYYDSEKASSTWAKIITGIGIFLLLACCTSYGGIDVNDLIISVFVIIFGLAGIIIVKIYNEQKVLNNIELAKKSEEDARKKLAQIREKNSEIRKKNNELDACCNQMKQKISQLETLLVNKNEVLEKLYNYNIIHFDYRNLYCISKIYHLLDTGICNTLIGVDGAYSQMRADQIIENQKISIAMQEKLLATNQMMYNAINKTNNLLGTISQQSTDYNQMLSSINNNLEMQNFIMQSSSEDLKALNSSAEYLTYAKRQERLEKGYYD